ncbi:MAG: hypothetical protein K2X81_08210 [Candidatus Obscuribacterales bacterium]|nr:hypothetical protein [Candidatus Obscuribacterales bacterium]
MVSDVNDKSDQSNVQSQVSRQILQEEAQRELSGISRMPLHLSPKTGLAPVYGPPVESEGGFAQRNQNAADDRNYRINDPNYGGAQRNLQSVRDDLADRVFPGFGRLQAPDNSWRLDYVDPSACNTRARVGLCFKIKH